MLTLMAEGRSNGAIAARLVIGEGALEKHVANIFTKLGLPVSESDNRRVLAVLPLPRRARSRRAVPALESVDLAG